MGENEPLSGNCRNHPTATAVSKCARCQVLLCPDCEHEYRESIYCRRCAQRARLRTDALRAGEIFFYTTVIIFITSAVLSFSGEKRSVLVDWSHLSAYGAVACGLIAGAVTFVVNRIRHKKAA